jgi:hypothetical protein
LGAGATQAPAPSAFIQVSVSPVAALAGRLPAIDVLQEPSYRTTRTAV